MPFGNCAVLDFIRETIKINFIMTTTKQMTSISQVYTTKDYFLFKSIDGNRSLNLLHLNSLKESMKDKYLFTVIIVNENHEIIDGQHRFEAAKSLGLPLNYVVCKGYGLPEVHRFNQNSKTWTMDDYLTGYCDMEVPEYLRYKAFKDAYGFGHTESLSLLGHSYNGKGYRAFFNGDLKIKNYKKACENAEKLLMLAPYYEGYKRRSFVLAILSLFLNPNFEFTELISKLKLQPTALQDCTSVEAYKILIEEIYNYRRREKVNLRF